MLNIDPEEIHERILTVGEVWSDANTLANIAEDAYKHTLNLVVQEKLHNGSAKSMTDADSQARTDDRVLKAAQNRTIRRGDAEKKKVKYDAAKIWFEAMRTKAATLRQEMKTLPHTT